MRCLIKLACLSAAAFLLPQIAVAAGPFPSYAESGFTPQILDSATGHDDRLQAFAAVVKLAGEGEVRAQDLAGTLYWRGTEVDGSPVETDLALARRFLANAAVNGELNAMAKLAELELADGQIEQSMVWAQLYARYLNPITPGRTGRHGMDAAYAADLIERIGKAGGQTDEATRASVASMVNRFDESIRRGISAFNRENRSGAVYLVQEPFGTDKVADRNVNGLAEYMVEFDPSGAPGRVWLLDSVPDAHVDVVVRPYLDQVRANTASKDSGSRYLKVSIVHEAAKSRALRRVH